jgi:hypothetical protein
MLIGGSALQTISTALLRINCCLPVRSRFLFGRQQNLHVGFAVKNVTLVLDSIA